MSFSKVAKIVSMKKLSLFLLTLLLSFAGFAPITDPRVLIYIVIDEVADPELSASSSPATKLSAAIMKEILPYLGVYPDGDIDYHVDLNMIADMDNENYDPFEDENNPFVLPDDLPDEGLDVQNE